MCQTSQCAPGSLALQDVEIAVLRRLVISMLEVEIRPDQPPLVAVVNGWNGAQCGIDVRQLVKLECGIGLQQVEVARVCQRSYRVVDGGDDFGQSREIAADRGLLVEAIKAPRYRFRVSGPGECGNIVCDAPHLGGVT